MKNLHREFLHPKSMLTPGIAGAVAMLITNTLASQFGLPSNYTALIVSFAIGVIVFVSMPGANIAVRLLYYVLNSLVILSVAIGTNQAGVKATGATRLRVQSGNETEVKESRPFFSDWFTGDAFRAVELWLDRKIDDDELRSLLLGAEDLRELRKLRREGERQIEHDRKFRP